VSDWRSAQFQLCSSHSVLLHHAFELTEHLLEQCTCVSTNFSVLFFFCLKRWGWKPGPHQAKEGLYPRPKSSHCLLVLLLLWTCQIVLGSNIDGKILSNKELCITDPWVNSNRKESEEKFTDKWPLLLPSTKCIKGDQPGLGISPPKIILTATCHSSIIKQIKIN
jgi:hypothetical protein